MHQKNLPADPISLILGILSIVIVIGGTCCYGLPAILTLIMSIIMLIYSNRSLEEYRANPELYTPNSRSNVYTGKVLNIIAIVISSIYIVFITFALILYGTLFAGILSNINQMNELNSWEEENQDGYYYEDDETEDDVFTEDDSLYYYQDSIRIDTPIPINEETE